jgi:hypothetical protein
MPGTIEKELVEATVQKQKKGEGRQTYLERLAAHLDDPAKFPDTKFDALTDPTQKWVNAACAALGKKTPVPEFPAEGEEVAKAAKPKKGAEKTGVAKTGDVAKAEKPPKAAKEPKPAKAPRVKKEKVKKEPADWKVTKVFMLKELVLKDPDMKVQDLVKALAAKKVAVTPARAAAVRAGFINSLRVAAAFGYLTKEHSKKFLEGRYQAISD